jgi:two-component system phosphate regulon response regulator PhoB
MVETVRGAGYRLTAINNTGRPAQGTSISAA